MADNKPSPGQPLDPTNHAIVIQNNYIAEGVTININSSNSYGSTVTKLEYVAAQPAESTSSQGPLARPLEPVDYGRESVVFNGNTLGQYVVINIASPHSTGAELYDSLPLISQTNRSSIPWTIQKPNQTPNQERLATGLIIYRSGASDKSIVILSLTPLQGPK
ncbi:hypothetical protein C8R48DRAFT_772947 [Suillus tomentosus]|nr:hypothetical protein C8R48DRAFT_772947 [Suillus tomentosus]